MQSLDLKPEEGKTTDMSALLYLAGFGREDVRRWKDLDRRARTDMLIDKYGPEMAGRELGSLLKLIRRHGDPDKVARFYVDVINGPPVPAQLLVLHSASRPEFREYKDIQKALTDYLADFETLTEAYSWYEDKSACGCARRGACNG